MTTINGTFVTAPATTTSASTPTYSLDIEVSKPTDGTEIFRGRAYYRLRLEVVNAYGGVPAEVFVHQQTISTSLTEEVTTHDDFISVAGPLDLVNIPVGSLDANNFHRLSHVDLMIESVTLADQVIDLIRQALVELLDGLRRLDNLEVTDSFTVGS